MITAAKICGLTTADAVAAASDAGAGYLGFVFFPRSPRAVTPAEAARLAAHAPPGPRRVGLFVAPGDDEIAAALAALPLDILQIHATPAARAAEIRARFGRPVWRAVPVASPADLPHDAGGADALLLDAPAPPSATRPGGNANCFDWSLLAGWRAPGEWVLAGGLTPANVAAAVQATGAKIVDVSSGVEGSPGVKDPALIRRFLAALS